MAKKINWSLQEIDIKDIKDLKDNPRLISREDYASLEKSIETFGLIDKPILNLDCTCISGHQRLRVMRKHHRRKTVACWIPDRLLSAREVKELCVRMNRNHGEFDYDLLANDFDINDLLEWGFDASELCITVEGEEITDEKVSKKSTITVSFEDCEDLQAIETEIREIAERHNGQVKVKI